MINEEILAIKDSILKTVGKDCERIILFGSYAYGTPKEGSDYDVFVVLKDGAEKPILVLQNIYGGLAQNPNYKAVDVLANYKSRFEVRSKLPTIERTIAQKGVVLYDAARVSGQLINSSRQTERSVV
jgi:predicted nucleotidyltransferase